MDEDFVPNFIYRSQNGELANERSILSHCNGHMVISRNNYLEVWDVQSKEVVIRIGSDKKETISSFCVVDEMFVLGYENGTIRAFNSDNIKMFGFRYGRKRIGSLFYVHKQLYIGTAGRICSYDSMKNEIVMEYERQGITNLPVMHNSTYFVCYMNCKFCIYQYGTLHPVHVLEVEEEVLSFCVLGNILVFLNKNGQVLFFALRERTLVESSLNIKKAHTVRDVNGELYILTSKKLVYRYDISIVPKKSGGETISMLSAEKQSEKADEEYHMNKEVASGRTTVLNEDLVGGRCVAQENEEQGGVCSGDGRENDATEFKHSIPSKNVDNTSATRTSRQLLKIRDLQPVCVKVRAITWIGKDIYGIDTSNKVILMEKSAHKMVFLCYHRNEIMQIKLCGDVIFTLSEDKLIKWKVIGRRNVLGAINSKELTLVNSKDLQVKTRDMCLFGSSIVLVDCEGVSMYSIDTLELEKTKKMENVSAVCSSTSFFGVARNNELHVMDRSWNVKCTVTDESEIVFIRFSGDEKLVGISNYNNKINIYKVHSMELVMSLYGHSLPVRCFDFSNDSKSVVSCSADKLVKLWGTEFGECRKTFYVNSSSVMFMRHNKDMFLAADNDIHCYKKNEIIKRYKNFDIKLFDYNDEYLVAAGKYCVYLYEMDRYELVRDSSSESEDELEIENIGAYDKFHKELEKSREDNSYDTLFGVIKELGLGDVGGIVSGLDNSSLYLVLRALESNINYNIVLATKLFFSIVEHHRNFAAENQLAYKVYREIKSRIEALRRLIKENRHKMSTVDE